MGLPAGIRSLNDIRRLSGPADRIPAYATLLELILRTFKSDDTAEISLNNLIELHRTKFTRPPRVFFANSVRNDLIHALGRFSAAEWADAAGIFDQAIQDVCRFVPDDMGREFIGNSFASSSEPRRNPSAESKSDSARGEEQRSAKQQPPSNPPPRPVSTSYSRPFSQPSYGASSRGQSSSWWFVLGAIFVVVAIQFWTSSKETAPQISGPTTTQPTANQPQPGSQVAVGSDPSQSIYSNRRFGYTVSYPSYLRPQGESDNHDGQKFISDDGAVSLTVWGMDQGQWTLDGFYEQSAKDSGANTTYKLRENDSLAASGVSGDKAFYERLTLRGHVFWGFRVEYDQSREVEYADLPGAITKSFQIPINEVAQSPSPTPVPVPAPSLELLKKEHDQYWPNDQHFVLRLTGGEFVDTPFHLSRDNQVVFLANGRFEIAWADNSYTAYCETTNVCQIALCPSGAAITTLPHQTGYWNNPGENCVERGSEARYRPLKTYAVYPETTVIRVRNLDVDALRLYMAYIH